MNSASALLAALAVALVLLAVVAFALDLLMVAGVAMLATAFVIYLRETRT